MTKDAVSIGDYVSIKLDGVHEAFGSMFDGIQSGFKEIRIGNSPTSSSDGVLSIGIRGDPSRSAVSSMEFTKNSVTAVAFADLGSGIIRSGLKGTEGDGEVLLIVLVDADMTVSTMARAMITANEGVIAVIQDLGLRYGSAFATGSVKQDILIVCRKDLGIRLRGSGNHCKLGELIGATAIEAVRESASHNGVSIETRRSIIDRMAEYGYAKDDLLAICPSSVSEDIIISRDSDGKALSGVLSVLHICDCIGWGLIPEAEGTKAGRDIIRTVFGTVPEEGRLIDSLAESVARYLFMR